MFLNMRSFTIVLILLNVSKVYGNNKECDAMDIRVYKDLDRLSNCTVILGNLALVISPLFEPDYSPEEINKRTFPLREVTGYVLFYSLTYLNSLGTMFPNLTVIRGHRLFSNYALVIYDSDLQQISLRNLLKINRGSVRIDGSNPRLCMPKIDWDRIIMNGKLVVGKASMNSTSMNSNCTWMKLDRCGNCEEPGMCWHSSACQRFESSYYPSRYRKTVCHSLCLGDCFNPTSSGCYTCKDISEDSRCVEKCSENKVLNPETRRCIDESECIKQRRLIHQNLCVQDCPSGYSTQVTITDDNKNGTSFTCQKCREKCPKFCAPPELRRVSQLEAIGVGCTIVKGDLEINIVDDVSNLTAELQTYLGDIEEIWGILKIHRSPPITELTFLNKLRIVEGKKNKTSIHIFENQNLQTIFDWRLRGNAKLKLRNGNIQIFSNMLLCGNETRSFQDIIERSGDHADLIQNNGAKSRCTLNSIETSFYVLSHDSCAIRWKDVKIKGTVFKFKTFIIQYVPIKSTSNLDDNILLERDSCSSYGWQHVFVKDLHYRSDGNLEYNLTGLSQFTTYAFTVQTYQYGGNELSLEYNTEYDGAISAVNSFRTLLSVPSRVRNFGTIAKSQSKITVQWAVIENEEPAIEFFYLDVLKKPFNVTLIDRRNYCTNPIAKSEAETVDRLRLSQYEELADNDEQCCDNCCQLKDEGQVMSDQQDLEFQETLAKLGDQIPRKFLEPRVRIKNNVNFVERIKIPAEHRNFTVGNLDPFTLHTFYLHACSSDIKCSEYETHSEMTQMNSHSSFDRVQLRATSYEFESRTFSVHFEEPKEINGVIISYHTELREVVENSSVHQAVDCVTRHQHELSGFKYSIDRLLPGTYEFRVRAVSLAGNGQYTDFHQFKIIKPVQPDSTGWIIFSAIVLLILVSVMLVCYYFKHKVRLLFRRVRRTEDTDILLQEIEPTDFHEISLNHDHSSSSDNLSQIFELVD